MDIERRFAEIPVALLRSEDKEEPKNKIEGYAAVFESRSADLGGFTEIIHKKAFDAVIGHDVRGLINHDPSKLIGRTSSGTMQLSVDERGLKYVIDLPDTQEARDLRHLMERGDIDGSSFGFVPDEDEWELDDESGAITRHIKSIRSLLDVGPVTYPAYNATEATMRSLNEFRQEISEGGSNLTVEQLVARVEELEAENRRLEASRDILKRALNVQTTATAADTKNP